MRERVARRTIDNPTVRKYRALLIFLFIITIIGIAWFAYARLNRLVPDRIRILVDKTEEFDFGLPIKADIISENISVLQVNESNVPTGSIKLNLSEPFLIQSSETGSHKVVLKLFGFIKLKQISLDVIESMELIPCGTPIGITLQTDGILVLGTSKITGSDGSYYEPALSVLQTGDYITAVEGIKVMDKEHLIDLVQKSEGESTEVTIRRRNHIKTVILTPIQTVDGEYKIGTWIRDDTQGIGTLTFLTTTGEFGALGHGITDVDTGILMEVGDGNIYYADIVSIIKGKNGTPGELAGVIHQNSNGTVGSLLSNTEQGIFGKVSHQSTIYQKLKKEKRDQPVKIGLKQSILLGPATILCHVDGEVKEYDIEIEKIDLNSENMSKGIILRITDEELISKTGGIVQGMSGSPILQGGRIIGAITHVFVKNPQSGYGTFIENMINNLQE